VEGGGVEPRPRSRPIGLAGRGGPTTTSPSRWRKKEESNPNREAIPVYPFSRRGSAAAASSSVVLGAGLEPARTSRPLASETSASTKVSPSERVVCRASGGIRTLNLCHLKATPLPVGLRTRRAAWCLQQELNLLTELRRFGSDPSMEAWVEPSRGVEPRPVAYQATVQTKITSTAASGRGRVVDREGIEPSGLRLQGGAPSQWPAQGGTGRSRTATSVSRALRAPAITTSPGCAQQESNLRSPARQAGVLPLNHARIGALVWDRTSSSPASAERLHQLSFEGDTAARTGIGPVSLDRQSSCDPNRITSQGGVNDGGRTRASRFTA
jgi:hypothetical protein